MLIRSLSSYPVIAQTPIQTLAGSDKLKLLVRNLEQDEPYVRQNLLHVSIRAGGGFGTPTSAEAFLSKQHAEMFRSQLRETLTCAEAFCEQKDIPKGDKDEFLNIFKGIYYDILSINRRVLIERQTATSWGTWRYVSSAIWYLEPASRLLCVLSSTNPPTLIKNISMNTTQFRAFVEQYEYMTNNMQPN